MFIRVVCVYTYYKVVRVGGDRVGGDRGGTGTVLFFSFFFLSSRHFWIMRRNLAPLCAMLLWSSCASSRWVAAGALATRGAGASSSGGVKEFVVVVDFVGARVPRLPLFAPSLRMPRAAWSYREHMLSIEITFDSNAAAWSSAPAPRRKPPATVARR